MSQKKKSAKTWQEKQEKQAQKTAENKRKREAAQVTLSYKVSVSVGKERKKKNSFDPI